MLSITTSCIGDLSAEASLDKIRRVRDEKLCDVRVFRCLLNLYQCSARFHIMDSGHLPVVKISVHL